jgi:hypothetical protein
MNENKKNINYFPYDDRLVHSKFLKFPLLFQVLSIVFLILPLFNFIRFSALIVFLYILSVIIIGLAAFLTLASILEKDVYKKISSIMKIGILVEIILLLVIGN